MKIELPVPLACGTAASHARGTKSIAASLPPNLTRESLPNGQIVTLNQLGRRKQFIAQDVTGQGAWTMFENVPVAVGEIVGQLGFGGCAAHDAARARMQGQDRPLLWVQGDVCPATELNGISTFAVSNQPIRRVKLADWLVGSAWSDDDAEYCFLAGVLPGDLSASRSDQTYSCFEQIETALKSVGMDFSQVVRTWLYLDDLLTWYDEFNVARTRFFNRRGVFERLVPASTGIGAKNPAGAALAAGALAVRPKHDRVRIQEVVSPLQCPATAYRSAFSRAIEMAFPDHRTLMISGTASIAPGGKTVHADSTARQIHLTLDVVEAILKSRGMGWQDTTRAIGYFHDLQALPVFDECCRERNIPPLPLVPAHASVCRNDLWFEIELDAMFLEPAPNSPTNSPAHSTRPCG